MYDIIIIGGGVAGLTSAIYASRASKKVLVLEALSYGGEIINSIDIENYPGLFHISGVELANKLYNQAKELNAEIKFEKVEKISDDKIKEVVTNKNVYKTKSVIIATGLKRRKLALPNEEELLGKGVSYCATCDGNFYKDKDVAVVGGGNTALEDALYLSNIAKTVYLIHRRDTFRGDLKTLNLLKEKENVKIILNSNITKIVGENILESIEIKNNEKVVETLNISGLFIAIGFAPENELFKGLIDLDNNNYIIAGEDCKTNKDGIFVAGDIRTKEVRQLVTAASDGAVAATNAIKYVNSLDF